MYSYAITFHSVSLVGSIIFKKYFLIYFDAQNGSHLGAHGGGHINFFWGVACAPQAPLGDATVKKTVLLKTERMTAPHCP